jgi:hypothetical protein
MPGFAKPGSGAPKFKRCVPAGARMMAMFTTQQADKDASQRQPATGKPAGVRRERNVSLLSTSAVLLQRKGGCACGGGCPRCQAERDLEEILPIQAKLQISQPGDKYEQEADRVAKQIMQMPKSTVQWQINQEGQELLKTQPLITPLMQEEEGNKNAQVTTGVSTVLQLLHGRGVALPASTLAFFEPRFGYDFSNVRVHSNPESDKLNQGLQSHACTTGHDIFFRQGEYAPGNQQGLELLAHELVHVIQQSTFVPPLPAHFPIRSIQDTSELKIKDIADQIQQGTFPEGLHRAQIRHSRTHNLTSSALILQRNSIAQWVESSLGVATEEYVIGIDVHLAPEQILYQSDNITVRSGAEGTGIEIRIGGEGISIRFEPPLVIVPSLAGYRLSPHDIHLMRFTWNFTRQRWELYSRGPLGWHLVSDYVLGWIQEELARRLPARIFARRYNPFTDSELLNDLEYFGQYLAESAGSQQRRSPQTTSLQTIASLTLSEHFQRTIAESVEFVIPQGTRIVLSANLGRSGCIPSAVGSSPHSGWHPYGVCESAVVGGHLPEELRDLRVESIAVRFENHQAEVRFSDIRIVGIEEAILPYEEPLQMRYGTRIEQIIQGGQLPLRQDELVELVEQEIRHLILQYREIIPGIDLAQMLQSPRYGW